MTDLVRARQGAPAGATRGVSRCASVVAGVFLALLPGCLVGAEFRCDELAGNCVCSEPFNTATYDMVGEYYDPGDSTDKQCSYESPGYPVFVRNAQAAATSDAKALSRLPGGHGVEFFLGAAPGGNGSFWAGNGEAGDQFIQRYAVRFYVYTSPDYEFVGNGTCENSKLMQIDTIAVDQSQGYVHAYGFDLHTYDAARRTMGDCCTSGPPGRAPGFSNTTAASLRDRWWRYELVVTNRAGGSSPNGIRYQLFGKNVTDATPEIAILDTRVPCPTCRPNPRGLGAADLTPPNRIDSMLVNLYRQGECGGWRGLSHLMYAGWDTDEGQRIGSALEIEGASGSVGAEERRYRERSSRRRTGEGR